MRATSMVLRVAVVIALSGFLTPATWAQAPAAESGATGAAKKVSRALPANAPRAAAKPQDSQQEGIKVHGHWVIEVRNPDGTLATRREFKNFLRTEGAGTLARSLSRTNPIGEWIIFVFDATGSTGPCGTTSSLKTCGIFEVTTSPGLLPFANIEYTPGLTVALDAATSSVVLTGTTRAMLSGVISKVATMLGRCPAGTSTTGCSSTQTFQFFSEKGGFPAVNVQAGQSIDVTVRFTFS